MALVSSRTKRALFGLPFFGIALVCIRGMDIAKLVEHQEPFLESGKIAWADGEIQILPHFHWASFLDEVWRGTTATFSPSTLGYDSIGQLQMFSFLIDVGTMYAVWLIESCRVANAYTPAYLQVTTSIPPCRTRIFTDPALMTSPTIFTFAAQLLGIGSVAPLFYYLCWVFGPSDQSISKSVQSRGIQIEGISLLLPIILLFHTSEVVAAFWSRSMESRHYWTWAWQMAPLWIGIANWLAARFYATLVPQKLRSPSIGSPRIILIVLGTLSAGVWTYTILLSSTPLSNIFWPKWSAQSGFVLHTRQALQYDEICGFGSSFLWLFYSLLSLRIRDAAIALLALPVVVAAVGPGAAFIIGWWWRESILQSAIN